MSLRKRSIVIRGWIATVAAFAIFAVAIIMRNLKGFSWLELPPDRSLSDRICVVLFAIIPVALFLGPFAIASGDEKSPISVLVDDRKQGGHLLPLCCGIGGLALFVITWMRWGPYTGEQFTWAQGWRFHLGWFLMWWCFIYVRVRDGSKDKTFEENMWDALRR